MTRRRSKKRDESDNGKDPLSMLPLDLLIEILLKLPAKSVAKLNFVSKHLASIIGSKDFTNLYIARSSTRPRLLFIYRKLESHFLESCSHDSPSSDHQSVRIISHPGSHDQYKLLDAFSPPVRGLICLRNGTNLRIENPSTGQFITLPKAKIKRRDLFSFFGYDPLNDVYKVLCMTVIQAYRRNSPVVSEEHQVLTLGSKQKWRKIPCQHPHLPVCYSRGICINGVVYYCARIKNEISLICFDLTSEHFNVVKVSEPFFSPYNLVNYGGKIALCNQTYATHEVLVLQDAKKQEWLQLSHLVPLWRNFVMSGAISLFKFKGTLITGQLIFATDHYNFCNPYFLISYDHKGNNAKSVVIEGFGDRLNNCNYIDCFLDHVESPMLLSNVRIGFLV